MTADKYIYIRQIAARLLIIFSAMGSLNVHAESFEAGKAAYNAKDYKLAFEILEPLAKQGDSQAQTILGIMYDNGQGVALDPEKALEWYIKAAKQGVPVVQHDVGVKYFQKKDYKKAAYWWEQSANAGLADSQFNLGLMYYRGLGIEQDYNKAAELFFAAAKQGHGNAQYSLAVMYAFGQGVEKDYSRALPWFRKSATQGVAQAQFNLGVLYENGHGLEKDLNIAREWYKRAAIQGLQEASKKLAELNKIQAGETEMAPIEHPEPASLSSPVVATGMKRNSWVMGQAPKSYTLQLISVLNKQDVVKFIENNSLGPKAGYIEVIVKGKTHYSLIYGAYNTYEEAQAAVKSLPKNIQKGKPWIRNFGILQSLLKEGG